MTETPAETLRRAAEKARGLAAAATPGPWQTHDTHLPVGGHTATVLSGEGNDTELRAWLPTWDHEPWSEVHNVWNDAAYIAALHPGVALLIADWLDAEADCHEGGMTVSQALCGMASDIGAGEYRIQVAASTLDQAVAVARALLGEEADAA
jgi:hypothetical protein